MPPPPLTPRSHPHSLAGSADGRCRARHQTTTEYVCGVVVKQELAQLVGSAENWFAILHQGCSDSRVKTVERYRRLLLVVGAQDVDVDGCLRWRDVRRAGIVDVVDLTLVQRDVRRAVQEVDANVVTRGA